MERNTMSGIYSWIMVTALICWKVRCGKLGGYSFPVYTTASCPKSQSEWTNRSSVLNCTNSNGYICIPNENITELLEFCYKYPRIPIEKGICLILKRSTSGVDSYSCNQFRTGCPNEHYWSNRIFKYPDCLSIGHGCFLAEEICDKPRITTLGSVEITNAQDDFGPTTLNTSLQNNFSTGIADESNAWVWILVLGVFLLTLFTLVGLLVMIFGRGRKKTVEVEPHERLCRYGLKEKENSPPKGRNLKERELFEIEKTPFIEFKDEKNKSDQNQDPDSETLHSPTNTEALDTENVHRERRTKQGVDFPKTLCFEPRDVTDVVDVLRTIEDIYPEESLASLAHQLLQSLHIEEFKSRLKSLESRVTLVDPSNLGDRYAGDGRVCICRVEVKPSNRQLTPQEPKDSLEQFRSIKHVPRSFFVTSNTASVIDAKLAVYKKYKDMFEENKIRIFHVLDSNKDFLLYCTKYTIDSFQDQVEKLANSIPIQELHEIMIRAADIAFSKDEIKRSCQNIEIVSERQNIGSVHDGSYSCRSPFMIRRIKEALISRTLERVGQEFTYEVLAGILNHIQNMLDVQLLNEVNKIGILKKFTINTIGELAIGALVVDIVVQFLKPILRVIMSVSTVGSLVLTFVQSVDVNSEEWRNKIADELFKNISTKEARIIEEIFRKMKSICVQTAEDLREINAKLATASEQIPILDQEKLIDEWLLRDFRIYNSERCPSILQFIVGRRNGLPVMKVFLEKSDSESERFCETHVVNKPDSALFEYVDVGLKSEFHRKSKVKDREKKMGQLDHDTRKRIASAIKNERDTLFAKHSNITGISVSPVNLSGGPAPCIILYCLDAKIIPFGENPIPEFLGGFPCDIRESFLHFGKCDQNCQTLGQGCSIGRYGESSSGSLGFFVKKRNSIQVTFEGFLTAAHVTLRDEVIEELNERKLSECTLQNKIDDIVHPSWQDSDRSEVIGQVEDAFFGNHKNYNGIDASFVKTTGLLQKQEMHESSSYDIDSDEEYDVVKYGRTTGKTKGTLTGLTSVKAVYRAGIYLRLYDCFSIEDKDYQPFFKIGDSGAAVYVIDKSDNTHHPLGLAFGVLSDSTESKTLVSPIGSILDIFNLSVLQPTDPVEITKT